MAKTRSRVLHVLIGKDTIGHVEQSASGSLTFTYDDAWRDGPLQIPLSLSMPLSAREHPHSTIEAFMWGLLPDNEVLLKRWGERFQVSPRNAFALLAAMGEDCAGAVQFLTDEKRHALENDGHVRWLTEEELGQRLAELRKDAAAGRRHGDPGQFSLAGAQAKTALHYDPQGDRWGVPEGGVPTTHIFKPPMPALSGHTENEHFCLRLAAASNLITARSEVRTFAGEKTIVVERYDRQRTADGLIRIHQEDMCQALAVHPFIKYEKDGGPGIVRIMNEVLNASDEAELDRIRFMEALVFNFLIVGTDAHAKNYSMLLGPRGSARLAPFYDLASLLPHLGQGEVEADLQDLKMAMRIGKTYPVLDIMPRHWEQTAKAAGFPVDMTMALLRHHIAQLPDLAVMVAEACRRDGVDHPVLARLTDLIAGRCRSLAGAYGAEALT
ncbi:MAG TPA: type II toxin-antitoxin system HipA family toxin [Azospirillum sp.]|nr:type II toxin-antitoxin system HipA family toxin [Azospirillum sp.]